MDLMDMLPYLVIIVLICTFLALGYVKAPPDAAYIISGIRKEGKVLIGRAGFKIPFLERLDIIPLKLIPLDIKTGDAVPTSDCINIFVDSAVNVKVGSDGESVSIAAQNFLNKTSEEIGMIVSEVLEGNIREIICTMQLRELIGDRKTFVERVSQNVIPDLKSMGLELVSFNVQRFSDANNVIDDLGIDNIAQIKKEAAIAKANADKEVEIACAIASEQSNSAKVKADTEIAMKQNELAIKRSELKKIADIKTAEADAAYKIQEQEQRKSIEIETANANLAAQEKELELKEREVAIKERTLEAEIKKQAEAEKYAKQQQADAELYKREKAAEASLFETQRQAEAEKAKAAADRFAKEEEAQAIKAMGLAEAEAVKANGFAQAESTQAKAEAEAAGILKKAEAMKEYGEAARQQMELDTLKVYFEQLPKIADAIGNGYTKVDSIKLFGGDSSQLAGDIVNTVTQVTDGVKESTGIDLNTLLTGFLGGKLSQSGTNQSEQPSVDITNQIKTDKNEACINQVSQHKITDDTE
ncbi:MAG: SPFH domain-containing protein [Eubacteriales bacterium]